MYSRIHEAAARAGLTPLVTRIALLLADIDGEHRAAEFIESCRLEDEHRASLCENAAPLCATNALRSPRR